MRPPTVVVSRISGLREVLAARCLADGPWIRWHADVQNDDAQAALAECEVLVGEPAVCAPIIASCPKLKWMQSTFAGCNQLLDQPRRDFVATRLGGCFGADMAEYTMLHILARERRYEYQREQQRQKTWLAARDADGNMQGGAAYRRLSSLTLGVLGLGEIGSCIAQRATRGFGMRVVGWRRDGTRRASDDDAGVSDVFGGVGALPAFLAQADYYVAVLPSTPQTRGLLDGDALAPCLQKKPTLINCGRGDLLSEQSIISALAGGQLASYVGDVYAPEPLDAASPLWHHPDVTVTPHNSAVTQPDDVAAAFEGNLARYEAGGVGALEHVFNWEAGY